MIFWNIDLESMSFVHSKFETWRVPGSIPMIVGRKNWWMAVDWDLLLSASWSSFLVIVPLLVHLSVHLLVRLLLHPCPPPFSPPSSPPWPLSCPIHIGCGLESLAVSFLVIRTLIIFLGNNQLEVLQEEVTAVDNLPIGFPSWHQMSSDWLPSLFPAAAH